MLFLAKATSPLVFSNNYNQLAMLHRLCLNSCKGEMLLLASLIPVFWLFIKKE
jgi:NAD-dependent oxidoreductase involved in siderophore biosynthesis